MLLLLHLLFVLLFFPLREKWNRITPRSERDLARFRCTQLGDFPIACACIKRTNYASGHFRYHRRRRHPTSPTASLLPKMNQSASTLYPQCLYEVMSKWKQQIKIAAQKKELNKKENILILVKPFNALLLLYFVESNMTDLTRWTNIGRKWFLFEFWGGKVDGKCSGWSQTLPKMHDRPINIINIHRIHDVIPAVLFTRLSMCRMHRCDWCLSRCSIIIYLPSCVLFATTRALNECQSPNNWIWYF